MRKKSLIISEKMSSELSSIPTRRIQQTTKKQSESFKHDQRLPILKSSNVNGAYFTQKNIHIQCSCACKVKNPNHIALSYILKHSCVHLYFT